VSNRAEADTVQAAVIAQVMEQLNRVQDPCSVAASRPMGLVDMGLIDRLDISTSGEADVYLRLTSPACYLMTYLESAVIEKVSACAEVTAVRVHPDEGLDWSPSRIAAHVRPAGPESRAKPEMSLPLGQR
jgi:metal-sulfur cluster biosynthetic enzyme